jgi:hypothetical protein
MMPMMMEMYTQRQRLEALQKREDLAASRQQRQFDVQIQMKMMSEGYRPANSVEKVMTDKGYASAQSNPYSQLPKDKPIDVGGQQYVPPQYSLGAVEQRGGSSFVPTMRNGQPQSYSRLPAETIQSKLAKTGHFMVGQNLFKLQKNGDMKRMTPKKASELLSEMKLETERSLTPAERKTRALNQGTMRLTTDEKTTAAVKKKKAMDKVDFGSAKHRKQVRGLTNSRLGENVKFMEPEDVQREHEKTIERTVLQKFPQAVRGKINGALGWYEQNPDGTFELRWRID